MKTLVILRGFTSYKMIELFQNISDSLVILTKDKEKTAPYFEKAKKSKNRKMIYTTSILGYIKEIIKLKKENFDLVISNCPTSGILGWFAKRLYKSKFIMIMCQDYIEYLEVSDKSKLLKFIYKIIFKSMLRISLNSAKVVVLSNHIKNKAIKYGAKNPVILPVYGVDTNFFKPIKTNLKSKLGIKEKIIFSGGRISPEKGLDHLIKAFKIIKEKIPNIKLIITGDECKTKTDLERLVKKLNLEKDVIFLNRFIDHKEMVEFYNICEVFVIPSIREGLGFTSAEALACEKPVVGSNVGGIPDIVKDGYTGLLVKPGNPEELANAIIKLLNNLKLCKKLGENGRKFVKENYEEKVLTKRFYDLTRSVL